MANRSESANRRTVKRVGQVIELDERYIDEYKELHSDGFEGVRPLLSAHNLSNFSIFLCQVHGRWLEFGYFEYTGSDFDADMAALHAVPAYEAWLRRTGAMQIPLPGEDDWVEMERVFFHE